MPDHPSDKIWDEHDWERFLQEQERRTEKYMELLEKYLDHPQRDELIARELGWTHLTDNERRIWEEEVDAQFEQELADFDEVRGEGDGEEALEEHFHPLYQHAIAVSAEVEQITNVLVINGHEHPASVALRCQLAIAAGKLAAALNDEEIDEIGMTIAFLKRALHGINLALGAAAQIREANLLDQPAQDRIRERLFELRDGVVSSMGNFRAEFRRRYLS